ncbi:MAG TPA: PQQ-binding-like beta-propeller repeat protein [Thermoanaerobaculia bacterium]
MNGSALPEAVPALTGPNPFVGPRPFELGERLYGREREIGELHFRLNAERIVLLHSPSGAGKSSLVQAGLLPLLGRSFDVWGPTRVNAEPAGAPNRYVLSAIQGFEEGVPEKLRRPVEVLAGQTLAGYFEKRPRRRSAPQNVVLLFDQFEEILTVDPLAVEAKHTFFDQLGELLRDPRVWALFALREDYLAPLDPYARQVPTHLKNRFRIDLLGLAAAREAMVEPARQGGREFPAVDELVHDLATMKVQQPDGTFVEEAGRHVEPVQLQVACRRLWDAMPPEDLSIEAEDLERFGDVTEALAAYYADSVARIAAGDPARERAIRDWFGEALITAGGIRGQVLREAEASGGLANELIDRLRGTHLVRAEGRAGATWYELAHDRLIEPVQSDNAIWREKHLADMQRRAALWERQGRPPGLLLAGLELAQGERWVTEHETQSTEAERRFIGESRKAQKIAAQERRQAQRIRRLAVAATIIGVLALVACGFAARQWQKAADQRQEAETQAERAQDAQRDAVEKTRIAVGERDKAKEEREAAAKARLEAEKQKGIAEQESRNAKEQESRAQSARQEAQRALANVHLQKAETLTAEGRFALRSQAPETREVEITRRSEALAHLAQAVRFDPENSAARSLVFLLLLDEGYPKPRVPLLDENGHEESRTFLGSTSLSADGQRLVTANMNNRVRLFDTSTGKLLWAHQHRAAVKSLSISPDGRRVVTGGEDFTAQVWDAATGRALGRPVPHHGIVSAASFSPDGRRILTASWDGTARLWDTSTGSPVGKPLRHEIAVDSASFSPEGRRVVTVSGNAARLWDASTGKPIGKPLSHTMAVHSASFSPDGRQVITASEDGTAQLWDALTGRPRKPLPHQWPVGFASFSPDGRWVVTASATSAHLWAAATGTELGDPIEHTGLVLSASFSPDGQRVLTFDWGGLGILSDVRTGKTLGELLHAGALDSAAFSPDGQRVVTASYGSVRLWDVPTASAAEARLLADVAEVVGGLSVSDAGGLERIPPAERSLRMAGLYREAERARDCEPTVSSFLHWYFTPRLRRSLSPLSPMSVEEYIRKVIAVGTELHVREAREMFPELVGFLNREEDLENLGQAITRLEELP